MKYLEIIKNRENRFLFQISTFSIYITCYIILSLILKDWYKPIPGIIALFFALITDLFLSKMKIRIYIRFFIVLFFYFLLLFLINIFSYLVTDAQTYNYFDKVPFLFRRDSLVAIIFILFYFIFDSTHIKQTNKITYWLSTIILILIFIICLNTANFNSDINKTIFKNYFNYSMFLILIVGLFLIRHISINLDFNKRKFKKKDFLLFILLLLPIIFLLYFVTLQSHLKKTNNSNSALLTPNLFQFDFSNFIELKDEIKLSDDKVLILEMSGVDTKIENRVNQGLNKQIYVKRFSLEDYSNGGFKVAENFVDPYSPPVYISGYMWELKNKPKYKSRVNILETLYLINIDPSSLMGSDLLTKVVPVTNWEASRYKQIYKSYCYVFNSNYRGLMLEELTQTKFLKDLSLERKKVLLNWGNTKTELRIKELAQTITSQYSDPFYKALSIQEYLWDNYYYSLKPGYSENGSQLEHFLFDDFKTKGGHKAYCSYFAFSMTLMLRSLGIASRVAIGFAPDMKNRTLNFYEIRAMDGHAWVEVYFDDYGWITFDPTSSNIAPGEKYEFAFGNKQERDNYIEEILKNKDKMKDITQKKEINNLLDEIKYKLKNSIRWIGLVIFIGFFIIIILILLIKKNLNLFLFDITNKPRKKTIYLFRHVTGKLFDLGYRIKKNESILEFAERINNNGIEIISLTKYYQMAIFKEKDEFNILSEEINSIKKNVYNDINKFGIKKKIYGFLNISRLWSRIIPLIIFLFLFNLNNLNSQTTKSQVIYKYDYSNVDDYINESKSQIANNFFDQAVETLNEAEKKFPASNKPNLQKGDLYNEHELYENALIEFLKAKNKQPADEQLYENISDCYGKIGDDKNGLKTLEEAYKKLPDTENYPKKISENLYDNLGWLYFKVHLTRTKGIPIVNEGLKYYPNSPDLYMTLGTLYSDIWDYDSSKESYLSSIDYSFDGYKSNSFRAIVYYNLAILENSFFKYEDSYNSAKASISLKDRSSAHLQLNYLYLGSLDLKNAFKESQIGSGLEPKTMFPEMSITYIYILSGRLDEAINLIKDLLNQKDFSWMLNFGTNKDSYYGELYKNLALAYEFKSNQIKYNGKKDLISKITLPFKRMYYYVNSLFYNFRFANLNIKIGEEMIKGGSEIEGLHYLYNAYEKIWSSKAYKILLITEKIESQLNPQKTRIFNLKKAVLKKKTDFFYSNKQKKEEILKNYNLLDQKWEKDIKCDSLIELINASSFIEKQKYTNELFLLHPPLLPMNNIKVDFNVNINPGNGLLENDKKKIIGYLNDCGINYFENSRFTLEITKLKDDYNIVLYDRKNVIKNYSIKLNNNNYENLGLEIYNKIFVTDLK